MLNKGDANSVLNTQAQEGREELLHVQGPDRLLCSWDFPDKNTGMGLFSPPVDLPDPGIEPKSPALIVGFFTTEPHGREKK